MGIGSLIVFLLVANIILLVTFAGFYFYVKRRTRRRERIQKKLQRDWAGKIPHNVLFPVRACDETRFFRFWKLFPWDRVGLLLISDTEVTLVLIDKVGEGIVRRISHSPDCVDWIGRKFWPNGLLHWFSVQSAEQQWYVTSETGVTVITSEKSTRLIYENLLSGYPESSLPIPPDPGDFALERHPLSLVMIGLFFLLLAYGIIDTFLVIEEKYVNFPFYGLTALIGVFIATIFSLLTIKSRIPNGVGIVLSLMVALTAAGSVYPSMLRLNQMTSVEDPIPYVYHVDFASNRLVPVDQELPDIRHHMKSTREFWQQIDQEEPFMVELRKGGLDFYQINMTPIYDQIRIYYKKQHD